MLSFFCQKTLKALELGMLLTDNHIIEKLNIKLTDKILDIGGSMRQHTKIKIDTLVDLIKPEDAPYGPTAMRAAHFVQADVTKSKLPFRDKEFDVVLCTHTLEDLSSPFLLIEEMSRVAKGGLIVTPSMGTDMVFTPIDFTDWLTGARRVPGEAHHKWFFVNRDKFLEIIPKNYPILYTSDFQVVGWNGDKEMIFIWKDSINYKEFVALNIHTLIERYESFLKNNLKHIKKGRAVFFWDNSFNFLKAVLKKILKRGVGYSYRKTF